MTFFANEFKRQSQVSAEVNVSISTHFDNIRKAKRVKRCGRQWEENIRELSIFLLWNDEQEEKIRRNNKNLLNLFSWLLLMKHVKHHLDYHHDLILLRGTLSLSIRADCNHSSISQHSSHRLSMSIDIIFNFLYIAKIFMIEDAKEKRENVKKSTKQFVVLVINAFDVFKS